MLKNLSLFSIALGVLIIFTSTPSNSQTLAQQKRNLTAFSKLYGYVHYFHPSDEAANIDWEAFSIYGAKKMLKAKDDVELIAELNKIFNSIAPTVKVFSSREKLQFDITQITPPNGELFKPISWQHSGFKLPHYETFYKSIRINRLLPLTNKEKIGQTYALTKPLNISRYKGKRFIFRIEFNVDRVDLRLKLPVDLNVQSISPADVTIANSKNRVYSFSGIFNSSQDSVSFDVMVNLKGNFISENAQLQVEDKGAITNIPISNPQSIKNPISKDVKKYIIELHHEGKVDEALFTQQVKPGEYINKELVSGISCIVPMALFGKKDYTYPRIDSLTYKQTKDSIFAAWPTDSKGEFDINGSNINVRHGILVIAWNVLKHSFPYWDDASKKAEDIWDLALSKSFNDKTDVDFLKTLKLMCAPLNDGHMFIDSWGDEKKATIPILFDFAENKVVVKKVTDSLLKAKIKPGDILKTVDGVNALKLLNDCNSYYSGSNQWKLSKSILNFLNGPVGSTAKASFARDNKTFNLDIERNHETNEYIAGSDRNNKPDTSWIKPGIFYINLNKTTTAKHMDELQKAHSIIIDMRGYLSEETETFAQHLINKPLKGNNRFFIPEILYPDFERINYVKSIMELTPSLPYIKAKVYILIDGTSQSASESFTGLYKDFKLATIVGQPSSGTNGNINYMILPAGYRIAYTGMLTKNTDGSKHHLNGVIPDVPVKPTLKGIKAGEDQILNKAIELAEKN